MPAPLLATKLHAPRPRRTLVERPRLTARLAAALEATLTLVSAPAGFGKTTLVADWVRADAGAAAWLSLDARDNDPTTFWTYVVAALRTAAPGVGEDALAQLAAPRALAQAALESLLNDLAAVPDGVVLVLDDMHLVEAPEVHDGLTFLLEHAPSNLHLVVATRADPRLPLARLRARGDLVEVRAADLRFTVEEATAYLTGAMGLPLTPADVAVLDDRTEGWIAALQLAALSVQGRDDVAGFLAGFSGDDRYVVDYLVAEVLQRQPADVRSFLLETAVLSRLSGPACDAVTGRTDGREVLEHLERQNLFVVPLDDARHWYRYHHLFADVLRAHLVAEQPDRVDALHRRASDWAEREGDVAEAVAHALAGGDGERAGALVERALPALRRDRQDATLRRWVEALPPEVVAGSPALSVARAGAVLVHGQVDGVEEHLRDAERLLATGADDDPERQALERGIAMYRAGQARLLRDADATVHHARRLLALTGEDDVVERGAGSALLGLALWESGELDGAAAAYAESVACFRRAGYLPDVMGCSLGNADIERARGRLDAATTVLQAALREADRAPSVPRGTVDMHVALAEVSLDRGDVDAAVVHLHTAAELGEPAGLAQSPYRRRVATALVRVHEGDVETALALLDEAEALCDTDFSPDVRPVAAVRARVLIGAGRLDGAADWARERRLSTDDELSYLREFEHITFAQLLVARRAAGQPEPGLEPFLARLLQVAESGGRAGSVVEVLVLQALVARDPVPVLRRAVAAADATGLVAPLLAHRAALAGPLRAVDPGPLQRRLFSAPSVPAQRGPVDPLSPRELDVLRLLASELDGPDIARRLFVSVNTLRTHTKSIYAKLGVTSRRAAVSRAQQLDLV